MLGDIIKGVLIGSAITFVGVVGVAICTKPSKEELEEKLEEKCKTVFGNEVGNNLIGKITGKVLISTSDIEMEDIVLCKLAYVHLPNNSQMEFIGVFNNWYRL